jgi:hypothetical protein
VANRDIVFIKDEREQKLMCPLSKRRTRTSQGKRKTRHNEGLNERIGFLIGKLKKKRRKSRRRKDIQTMG